MDNRRNQIPRPILVNKTNLMVETNSFRLNNAFNEIYSQSQTNKYFKLRQSGTVAPA